MAILTAISPVDMSYNGNSWWSNLPSTSMSATQIAFDFGFKTATVNGTFTMGVAGPSGTITGTSIAVMGVTEATVTGLNVSVASYSAAFNPAWTMQAQFDASQAVLFAGADTANGSAGNDIIMTYGGNDILNGNAGNDRLNGGAGNDTINGGTGLDWADYSTSTTAVTVNLGLATAQNTGLGSGLDTLIAIEGLQGSNFNDILTGNALANGLSGGIGNDTLNGGGGNDILHGDAGNDIIIGGAGRDGMTGGLGMDTFKFLTVADSTVAAKDMIVDFTAGVTINSDKIDLSAIDAKTATAGVNDAFTFAGVANAFTAAGQVRMGTDGILYGNTDANLATAEFAINLNMSWNPGMVVAGNFIL